VSDTADPDPGFQRFDCTGDDPELLDRAAEAARLAIERGECIVLPTDTVYGIGADAFSPEAVQRLLDAKVRGRDMPPPVLIADSSLLRALAVEVPQAVKDLVAKHWPGPLTVICKAQASLRMDLGDTEGTIALRVPDHELARDILRRTGPMAVSSANISGLPAATDVDDAIGQLAGSVAVYIDGGSLDSRTAIPSTIIDFTQTPDGAVLRRGALSLAVIRETCPDVVDLDDPDEPDSLQSAEPILEPDELAEPDTAEPSGDDAHHRDQPTAGAAPYATTDELRITHTNADPDQPSLFEPADGLQSGNRPSPSEG
jgi:L-threonylcarbamoyladenylate synthase